MFATGRSADPDSPRDGEHPRRHRPITRGILQADAFAGNTLYEPSRKPGPIIEAACWSHAGASSSCWPSPRCRWPAFTRFLADGRHLPEHNAAERALRGIALGRRSWLFVGPDRSGEPAAAIYTLIATAKLNNVDPEAWLTDTLRRINDLPVSPTCLPAVLRCFDGIYPG